MKAFVLFIFHVFISLFSISARGDFLRTTLDEFISPVTTDAKYYLLGGSVLTATLAYDTVEDGFGDHVQHELADKKPLGKYSKFGDLAGQLIPNVVYIGITYGISLYKGDDNYRNKSIHMLKSSLYSGIIANILKKTVREPRPSNTHSTESFPSGHTTTAFAFAAVVGSEHEWYWGLAAYSMATFVGLSRINDNAHRLHDVVGGATLGISYGLSIYYLSKNKKSDFAKYSLAPYGNGLTLGYRTDF